ncbi:T9SS type A sorting domain-containing protein [Aureivirga sp. CE67]|uniref:T9SS type A sorting domain-containing protein n=1 Tax=Aureivirga sp. CE67 TaxID=1788983 RepID=UPI0018C93779|nr:T9SS type A sorting domain-containing protein [Aureivirga sp. CE67]
MKKNTPKKLLIALISIFSFNSFAQCPDGDVTLNSQEDIDQFIIDYPNCTEISGDLNIISFDAENLSGLENITSVANSLNIQNLFNIENFNDLNIQTVGELVIKNISLTNLEGLNITTVSGDVTVENNNYLISFEGLNLLTSIGGNLIIENNDSILNFEGFDMLESIGGDFHFSFNEELYDTTGFDSLTTISGELFPEGNPTLINLIFDSIITIGSLRIDNSDLSIYDTYTHFNEDLTNISFSNLEIVDNLFLYFKNDNVIGLNNTFSKLTTSEEINIRIAKQDFFYFEPVFPMIQNCKTLKIYNYHGQVSNFNEIENISDLENLYISGNFMFENLNSSSLKEISIQNNVSIENLTIENSGSLNKLTIENTEVLENLNISNTDNLYELKIIENDLLGSINIPNSDELTLIEIIDNPNLDLCSIDCDKISELYHNYYNNDIFIENNGENCSIDSICLDIIINVDEEELIEFSILPNPASKEITVVSNLNISKIEIFDITGKKIIQKFNTDQINVQNLENGIYFIKIFDSRNNIITEKFVKE